MLPQVNQLPLTPYKNIVHRRLFLLITFILFFGMACSLLQGPQSVVVPTPVPLIPVSNQAEGVPELVIDPVSDIVPNLDPDVQQLMASVSQQQLIGYVQTLENFQTRNTYSEVNNPAMGVGAARLWIQNEFLRVGNGRLLVQADDFSVTQGGTTYNQQNIVATLPGVGTYRGVLVLSAHYDSRTINPADARGFAPGANDNGSGIAALLEMARLLSSRTWNQTIVFVAFAAEEQGRFGSIHYVNEQRLNGTQFDGVINMDIVGGRPGIPQSIRLFTPGTDTAPTMQFARYLNYIGGLYLPQFPITVIDVVDREGRFSDHITFLDAGVPAVRLTESQEDPNRQHNARDTWDGIDFNYLTQVTQLSLAAAVNVIGAPGRPQAPLIAPMSEQGSYILTWNKDPKAAGYALSFRPVGSVAYPPFRFVNALQSGNVAMTGLDPNTTYYVSMAVFDGNGRISLFSPETPVGP